MNVFAPLRTLAALALAAGLAAPAQAAVIGLQVEGGGSRIVYELTNGDRLGLWGFDNRERANPGAGAVTIGSFEELLAGFRGAGRIRAFYNGPNPVNPGAKEFDPLEFGFTIADNARLSNSLWVRWSGGELTYVQPSKGTTSMGAAATRPGDPLAERAAAEALTPVPVPAALPLFLAGLGILGLFARLRRTA